MTFLSETRAKLQKVKRTRSTLENNLLAIQRNNDEFGMGIEFNNPFVNPEIVNSEEMKGWRIKKMVNDAISGLSDEIQEEVQRELREAKRKQKRGAQKPAPTKRLTPAPARAPFPSAKTQDGAKKPTTKDARKKPTTRANLTTKKPTSIPTVPEDEHFVTTVYGRAPYHSRRSTNIDPYLHMVSPHKSPKFRQKRVLETISANKVRSEKCQTDDMPSSALKPRTSDRETLHNVTYLQPTAIALGPPKIIENEVEPLVIPADREAHSLSSKSSTEEILKKSQPKAVVEESPPVVRKVICSTPENDNVIPGMVSVDINETISDEPIDTLADRIQLTGAQMPTPHKPHSCGIKPASSKRSCAVPNLPLLNSPNLTENEAVQWVEQELMARILSQVHPHHNCLIQRPPPDDTDSSIDDVCEERGLPFLLDTGVDINQAYLRKLLDEELLDIIRNMIGQSDVTPTQPEDPLPPRSPAPSPPPVIPVTPIPTPCSSVEGSPEPSIVEEIVKMNISTPPRTPEPESSSLHEEEGEVSIPEPEISEAEPIVPVLTPQVTPVPSVIASPKLSSPVMSIVEEAEPDPIIHINPWEGANFPLVEDTHQYLFRPNVRQKSFIEDDPCDVIVRPMTPPVHDAHTQMLSSSSSSDDESTHYRDDQTISEGQLLISHGEMKAKKIPHDLDPYVERCYDSLEGTLKDTDDVFDMNSEGEINARSRQVTKLPTLVPNIYSRPRKPLPDKPLEDDISIGEIVDDESHRLRFEKWKKSRKVSLSTSTPAQHNPDAHTLSVGDLDDEDTDVEESIHDLPPGVIKVTPYDPTTDHGSFQNLEFNRAINPAAFGQSLQTTGSGILPDSLDGTGAGGGQKVKFDTDDSVLPRNLSLVMPNHHVTYDDSDLDEVSVHEI